MDDYLPLSMLNQLEYCERRFFLMHVRGEMEVNAQHMTGKKNPKAFLPSDRGGILSKWERLLEQRFCCAFQHGDPTHFGFIKG